jgi:hypothetical protein
MDRLRRAFAALGVIDGQGRGRWYRRPESWIILAALVLPFGWLIALCRMAWLYAIGRWTAAGRQGENPSAPAPGQGRWLAAAPGPRNGDRAQAPHPRPQLIQTAGSDPGV